ncbi:hypothetical protein PVAP13_1KG035500 [Panicum virgatum]|uniref:Uncharacterized protein n=1 Tax=Panicum virgatum TaxID=38727 RepID=A0A8T0XD04_PANVG|nr:hypothetical protein PVAP13_1KG035500 [Panicum virgatum]
MKVCFRVAVTLENTKTKLLVMKKMSNFSQNGGSSWLMLDLELLWPLASWILATVSSLGARILGRGSRWRPDRGK